MIVYGMNKWKSAKASATADGSGHVRTTGEGDDPPIKKSLPRYPPPKDDATAATALSSIMRPAGEGSDPPIETPLSTCGSQKLQAVRPDENPVDDASQESRDSRPRRRRKRRTTRALGRPAP